VERLYFPLKKMLKLSSEVRQAITTCDKYINFVTSGLMISYDYTGKL